MSDPLPNGWQLESQSSVFESRYVSVRKDVLRRPDGSVHDWYVMEEPDIVVVFCVTTDGQIVLNRQYKFGAKEWVIEPWAGFVDPGEEPRAAALRELEEETGYIPTQIVLLQETLLSPSSQDNRVFLYYADGAQPIGTLRREASEIIELLILTPTAARDLVETGTVRPVLSLATIFFGLERLARETKG